MRNASSRACMPPISARCRMIKPARIALCAVAFSALLGGCSLKQDMALQPKNRPLSPSDFFTDGRSERPILENTVHRGVLADDALTIPKDSNAFPLPINQELLERGEGRFKIFCTPCHGLQGDGNGMVAIRGMKHPPTYHQDRLRQAPNGYFYDVITKGFGAMLGYSAQIPPQCQGFGIAGELARRPCASASGRSTGEKRRSEGMTAQDFKAPESVSRL